VLIQPYQLEELHFACCFRVYYRWRTHRATFQPVLSRLNRETLDSLLKESGIHILEASASESDVRVLASLLPAETVAVCASKMKGRVSKWLRGQSKLPEEQKLLSRGYFACTTGTSTAQAVLAYLESQGEHHGYMSRPLPPVFVASYSRTPEDEQRLGASHAVTVLQFHIVLSTWRRRGVFDRPAAEATADCWRQVQKQCPMFLEKVSFIPDHVHLAVQTHPSLSPAKLVVALMNASQELMWKDFANSVIQGRLERLWQPSAYIGSYGNMESAKVAAYVRKWETADEDPM
jgi:REP element-mobilizing transposase RayT